ATANFSLTVPTVNTNGWVFDAVGFENTTAFSAGNSQSLLWSVTNNSIAQEYGASLNQNSTHATSITDTWTNAVAQNYAVVGIAINSTTNSGAFVGPTTNATSFLQTPVFSSAFTIASNKAITVTNFITVTNGSIPTVNPAV